MKIAIASGKRSDGKTTVAVNLAYTLALSGKRVTPLDVSRIPFGPRVHARLGIGEENSGKPVTRVRKKVAKLAAKFRLDTPLSETNTCSLKILLKKQDFRGRRYA